MLGLYDLPPQIGPGEMLDWGNSNRSHCDLIAPNDEMCPPSAIAT
jgi:hypothetical protein